MSSTLPRSNLTACNRCRIKKKRCDQKLPRCRGCEIADVQCVGYDALLRREIPRSYVFNLEQRISELEETLRQTRHDIALRQNTRSAEAPVDPMNGSFREFIPISDDIAIGDTSCTAEILTQPPIPPPDSDESRKLLNDILRMQTSTVHFRPHQNESFSATTDTLTNMDASPLSLPNREAAAILTKAYFQFANLSQPLLFEPYFRTTLDTLYDLPHTIDFSRTHTNDGIVMAVFTVLEVFSIALLVLQKQDPAKIPTSLANRYHQTALSALNKVGLSRGIEGVQTLLLTAQYCYHHSDILSMWSTVGAALRHAVELGLHKDPISGTMSAIDLDVRRRTFWTAYAMDRNISIALGFPTSLADGAISAEFPSELDDDLILAGGGHLGGTVQSGPKLVCLHVFRWRLIQSEMQSVLCQKPPPGYPAIDIELWQERMEEKINAWYENMPRRAQYEANERKVIENFDLTYHRAIFYLYHPAPNRPVLPDAAWIKTIDAATQMVRLYRRFFDERRLTIYWQAVEGLSAAGIALLTGYTISAAVQARLELALLRELVQICSSVLWGMVEHFPAYRKKRDAFDKLVSTVLASMPLDGPAMSNMSKSTPQDDDQVANQALGLAAPITDTHPTAMDTSDHTRFVGIDAPTLADFELAAFDWDALENSNDILQSSWI